ncbi:MAG: hypothetical protein EXS17_08135 [Phycisphaerales bacterium]|nr:hypothetical protein [Phycisphaerales bacterium]
MPPNRTAWGIEVGQFALKALRVELVDGNVTVTDFAVIPHQRVLADPAVSDQTGMIRHTLAAFVSANQERLTGVPVVMSLPGNAGFARFSSLPSVEAKMLPSMVEYEAKQQIPFPIDEVEWDSHIFAQDESGQCPIGIFAVTKERLRELLSLYSECGIEPDVLTLSPVAVANALHYDLDLGDASSIVACIDIGTTSSDTIVIDKGSFWFRTFPIGGSNFTESIVQTLEKQGVNYGKAERIKVDRMPSENVLRARTMAMRGVTGQLVDEIGRSREFYQDAHHGSEIHDAYGVGSTLKISGLRTKIAGDLRLKLKRFEEFKRVMLSGPDAPDFAANSINLLTALGLGIQGLGLAKVQLNLSPISRVRQRIWKSKTPWFVAAASIFIATAGAMFTSVWIDSSALAALRTESESADKEVNRARELLAALEAAQATAGNTETANMTALLEDREVWAYLVCDTYAALATANPASAEVGSDPKAILAIAAANRRLVQLEDFSGAPKVDTNNNRQIEVSVRITLTRLPTGDPDPTKFFNETGCVLDWFRQKKERIDAPYTIVEESLTVPNWTKIVGGTREVQSSGSPDTDTGSQSGSGFGGSSSSNSSKPSFGGGGLQGRKKLDAPPTSGPSGGGTLGGAGGESGDGGGASNDGSSDPAASKTRRKRTEVVGVDEKLPALDLAKDAPIPAAPVLLTPTEARYEGILKFTVTLKGATAAPAPPVDGSADSQ